MSIISKANVLFVLLSLKPYNYDYIMIYLYIHIYLLWIMNFIYVYLVSKALLVCKLLPCISQKLVCCNRNRKCIRIKINDFCWSATRTQKTKPTKTAKRTTKTTYPVLWFHKANDAFDGAAHLNFSVIWI